MGRTNVRLQVTLQRLNLQYQQVRALTDQASGLDAAIAGSASEVERAKSQLAELQERMEQETNPDRRRDMDIERRSLHDVITREAAQEQELRRRSSDVAQMLATETGKLNELTDGLAELEGPAPARGSRRPTETNVEPAGAR
jgi:predicted RNase H-like nuclease (RuvC/YqgF family)